MVYVMAGSSLVSAVVALMLSTSLMLSIDLLLNIRLLLMMIVGIVVMVLFHVQSI